MDWDRAKAFDPVLPQEKDFSFVLSISCIPDKETAVHRKHGGHGRRIGTTEKFLDFKRSNQKDRGFDLISVNSVYSVDKSNLNLVFRQDESLITLDGKINI